MTFYYYRRKTSISCIFFYLKDCLSSSELCLLVCGFTSSKQKLFPQSFFIYREIFYIDFPPFSAQLLLSGVGGRSMWVENGLTGLEGLKSFSKRRNGSLGTVVKVLCVIWEYIII